MYFLISTFVKPKLFILIQKINQVDFLHRLFLFQLVNWQCQIEVFFWFLIFYFNCKFAAYLRRLFELFFCKFYNHGIFHYFFNFVFSFQWFCFPSIFFTIFFFIVWFNCRLSLSYIYYISLLNLIVMLYSIYVRINIHLKNNLSPLASFF